MCTVTYLPLGNDEFCLTSNRDETPTRQPMELYYDEANNLLFPKEPKHGGTWISVSADNRLVCLLNGAFQKHKHEPPYRKSRGLVVLDYFEYGTTTQFVTNYYFDGIEPFTMVIFDNAKIYDFRWDGETKHLLELDPEKPHIWSSSTLYNDEIKNKRIAWFQQWLVAEQENNAAEILKFHKTAGADDKENGLIMSRNNNLVCTVSITQVLKKDHKFSLKYFDRINNKLSEQILELNNA
jgi:uncharacterized protein with NRDE domain